MLERLGDVPGAPLGRSAYHGDVARETARLAGLVWKLERSQFFTESDDDPAWQAFRAGDWNGSLRHFEDERPDIRAEVEMYARQGSELRRLRVVEEPVSAYLQWEMHAFKVLADCGVPIRVLDAARVRPWEAVGPLPEVLLLEHQALYEVQYDGRWAACGARRIDDRQVIEEAGRDMVALWDRAEPLSDYFARAIAPLASPA